MNGKGPLGNPGAIFPPRSHSLATGFMDSFQYGNANVTIFPAQWLLFGIKSRSFSYGLICLVFLFVIIAFLFCSFSFFLSLSLILKKMPLYPVQLGRIYENVISLSLSSSTHLSFYLYVALMNYTHIHVTFSL